MKLLVNHRLASPRLVSAFAVFAIGCVTEPVEPTSLASQELFSSQQQVAHATLPEEVQEGDEGDSDTPPDGVDEQELEEITRGASVAALVDTIQVRAHGYDYHYRFLALPDGASGVGVQMAPTAPEPITDDDQCALDTYLRVAPSGRRIPTSLINACAPAGEAAALSLSGEADVGPTVAQFIDSSGRVIGAMQYRRTEASPGGASSTLTAPRAVAAGCVSTTYFEDTYCTDIEERLFQQVSWPGMCADDISAPFCRLDWTSGYNQITGSETAMPPTPPSIPEHGTTKTRWYVAACEQPVNVIWQQRLSYPDQFDCNWRWISNDWSVWYAFGTVSSGNVTTITLYAGLHSCDGWLQWNIRDFRVRLTQSGTGKKLHAAHGWVSLASPNSNWVHHTYKKNEDCAGLAL